MSVDWIETTSNFAITILIVNIFTIIRNWKLFDYTIKIIFSYLVFSLIIELVSYYLYNLNQNNLPLLHLYTFGEYFFFTFYFKKKINLLNKNTIEAILILIAIFLVINSLFLENIYSFNSLAKTVVQASILFYTIIYMFQKLKNINERNLNYFSDNLISLAILIYYGGSIFIFLFSAFMQNNYNGLNPKFWILNAILNIIFQILVLIALWYYQENKKSI